MKHEEHEMEIQELLEKCLCSLNFLSFSCEHMNECSWGLQPIISGKLEGENNRKDEKQDKMDITTKKTKEKERKEKPRIVNILALCLQDWMQGTPLNQNAG